MGPHCCEGRSNHTHCCLAVLFAAMQPHCLGSERVQTGSFFAELRCSSSAHGSLAATLQPIAAVLPPLVRLHDLISAPSVLPSLHPPYLLLNIYHTLGLLSSTQLPAQESLTRKARHAGGPHGQSFGWEKGWSCSAACLAHSDSGVPSVSRHVATPYSMTGLENDALVCLSWRVVG